MTDRDAIRTVIDSSWVTKGIELFKVRAFLAGHLANDPDAQRYAALHATDVKGWTTADCQFTIDYERRYGAITGGWRG